ncbi:hypothetical protein M885DRAFT_620768 [Pelagophyceae sp. CCMP2097]|nr:hypothetical protein M885DRAFT_620768 [Pelagophyceae sp. CCMP2097]|mmetsp:Transcript_19796/g.66949  ORF Transcript_19796/g.66949 Transcript_19796/m.66949 type:complete len:248 (-) Transcript_19796:819-1562(-)
MSAPDAGAPGAAGYTTPMRDDAEPRLTDDDRTTPHEHFPRGLPAAVVSASHSFGTTRFLPADASPPSPPRRIFGETELQQLAAAAAADEADGVAGEGGAVAMAATAAAFAAARLPRQSDSAALAAAAEAAEALVSMVAPGDVSTPAPSPQKRRGAPPGALRRGTIPSPAAAHLRRTKSDTTDVPDAASAQPKNSAPRAFAAYAPRLPGVEAASSEAKRRKVDSIEPRRLALSLSTLSPSRETSDASD